MRGRERLLAHEALFLPMNAFFGCVLEIFVYILKLLNYIFNMLSTYI